MEAFIQTHCVHTLMFWSLAGVPFGARGGSLLYVQLWGLRRGIRLTSSWDRAAAR